MLPRRRRIPAGFAAAGMLLMSLLVTVPGLAGDDGAPGYRLGQGVALAGTGVRIGGYAEAVAADPDGLEPVSSLDALSTFLSWDRGGRVSAFAELELERGLRLGPGRDDLESEEVVLERLYLDYAHDDARRLRVGKFLTPIGRWNTVHAAPLTWTTSRPLITEATFPTNATGAMLHGVLPLLREGLEYAVYGSIGEELAPESGLDTFREALGVRLAAVLLPDFQLGLSYANFELESAGGTHRNLYGVDFAWQRGGAELSGEYVLRVVDRSAATREERGFYLQAVLPLASRVFAVARHEYLRIGPQASTPTVSLLGLSYRLQPGVMYKVEHSWARQNDIGYRDGWLASFAVLF